jgi:hypothetical protein
MRNEFPIEIIYVVGRKWEGMGMGKEGKKENVPKRRESILLRNVKHEIFSNTKGRVFFLAYHRKSSTKKLHKKYYFF